MNDIYLYSLSKISDRLFLAWVLECVSTNFLLSLFISLKIIGSKTRNFPEIVMRYDRWAKGIVKRSARRAVPTREYQKQLPS